MNKRSIEVKQEMFGHKRIVIEQHEFPSFRLSFMVRGRESELIKIAEKLADHVHEELEATSA